MQAVYSFTAASAGILSLTGTTVHMFDVYRKAGANWIKLQQEGKDVSIGYSQPEVSITLQGEYIVVPDNPRQTCAGGATFAFTPDAVDLDLLMDAIKLSTYGQTVNNAFGVPQHITIQIPL